MSSLPENPTVAEAKTVVVALAPDFESITDTLHAAVKASATAEFLHVETTAVVGLVEELVQEIVSTVAAVLIKLVPALVGDGRLCIPRPSTTGVNVTNQLVIS